ncbi:MAG: redoxin domain-containing protein [Nitrospiraceae bacterium]|nr:redoxin domain-containing protein [Nitrospiraceae bacterium]
MRALVYIVNLTLLCHAVPALEIAGSITDPAGQPIPGASVWVVQDRQARRTVTGEDGRFILDGVRTQPACVVAAKEGFALAASMVHVIGIDPVSIPLPPPAELRLRIKNQAFMPVEGARIKSIRFPDAVGVALADLERAGFPSVRSDESGLLVFPGLPKDVPLDVVVAHRGSVETTLPYLQPSEDEQPVQLVPGTTLRGRVINAAGQGVPQARVAVIRTTGGDRQQTTEILTGPEGFYRAVLKPGACYLAARHADYASPAPRAFDVPLAEETVAEDIVLPEAHVIAGSVMYDSGEPCAGVSVAYLIDGGLYEDVYTQFDGRFRLQTPGLPGTLRVTPPAGWMLDTLADIPIRGQVVPRLTLDPVRLVPLPAIEGVAVDAGGEPQPGVLITSRNVSPKVWAITDEQGGFRVQLARAPVDPAALFTAEHGLRFLRGEFEVDFKSTQPVRVVLKAFEPDLTERKLEKGQNDMTELLGEEAPEIKCGAWFNSPPLTLEKLRGSVVALTFWGGFDERSLARDALEELRALADLLRETEDVVFIGIHDSGEEPEAIGRYVRALRLNFPVARDAEPFQTYAEYNVHYIPQTILVDRKGIVRYFQTDGRLLELIKSLRREGAG